MKLQGNIFIQVRSNTQWYCWWSAPDPQLRAVLLLLFETPEETERKNNAGERSHAQQSGVVERDITDQIDHEMSLGYAFCNRNGVGYANFKFLKTN